MKEVMSANCTASSVLTAAGALMLLAACGSGRGVESAYPFMDPDLPVEERVEDLVSRMTLEEKVSQMMNSAGAVERLGIPEYNWWNEALHGVARAGRATVFPQAIGMAATWDTDLIFRMATAISDEARAKHHEFVRRGERGIYEGLTFWSPNINIFRDPRWGRGMETYGEDPYLTGRLSVKFVRGLQGDHPYYLKTVATPKHYAVHSGPEPERHSFDAVVDERDLRETYLPAFRASIVEGGAFSVMCAYNRFLGEACCSSDYLLREILRGEWGFEGYVVSDCGAIGNIYRRNAHNLVDRPEEAAARGVMAGTDLNCGSVYRYLVDAVTEGYITEPDLDVSVKRLFTARFRLGMFDPPRTVPWAGTPYRVNDSRKHSRLALEAARKSMVLLKNEGGLLPLKNDPGKIAVIGPNANNVEVLLGNYNGIPSRPVTPLEGIRGAISPRTEVLHSRGCDLASGMPVYEVVPVTALRTRSGTENVNGLEGRYFGNREMEGEPVFTRVDAEIDFNWWDAAPGAGMDTDDFSVRWEGVLVPPVTGTYSLAVSGGPGGVRLFFEGERVVQYASQHHPRIRSYEVDLEAGAEYPVAVEYWETNGDAQMQFLWAPPAEGMREQALDMARAADVVVLVMGLSARLEGEEMRVEIPGFRGGDRLDLRLPRPQEDLMAEIADLGKPTVLVLLSGSALAVNLADERVPAILQVWYPGQAAGTAIADVLFGRYNPAGRLPVTFYRSIDQLPDFTDYTMEGKTYRYFEGDPLYPFGHGLSYTTFEYGNLEMPASVPSGEDVTVSVEVRNTGPAAGEEVVQLYVTDLEASVPVPLRSLQGFRRIHLGKGQKRRVEFTLTPRQISLIDGEWRRVVEPGLFEVSVGGKQPGFSGGADAPTTGVVTGRFEVTGGVTVIPER